MWHFQSKDKTIKVEVTGNLQTNKEGGSEGVRERGRGNWMGFLPQPITSTPIDGGVLNPD
ncbi:MAG: hypothetical protein AAFV71_16095 [Cyanobacteria bacterium J06633_8]